MDAKYVKHQGKRIFQRKVTKMFLCYCFCLKEEHMSKKEQPFLLFVKELHWDPWIKHSK